MGFKQNQITWATTTTGFDSTNYNRHRNLFRLVFFEQRSHGVDKKKLATNEIIHKRKESTKPRRNEKKITLYFIQIGNCNYKQILI